MSALKDDIDHHLVLALATELQRAWHGFPATEFQARASRGLEDRELMARIRHVAGAVREALPDDLAAIGRVVDGALASASFDGWMVWPIAQLLGDLGPDDPHAVLPLMARLTHRASCEFAIRPCLESHPEATFAVLETWVVSPDEHVRRLVSEGTRPRLPWGRRLRALIADPRPSIALLDRLRDDASAYVRRSVANHLGDIAKDHPELALATARRWKDEGGDHVDSVIRHGLRRLLKAGDPATLALLGYDVDAEVAVHQVSIEPARLPIGGRARLAVALRNDAARPVPVIVEYLVHHLGARGPRKATAYRLADRTLEPGAVIDLRRNHRFAHASIRTLHPGTHLIEVQVNGRVLGSCHLELTGA